MIKSYNLITITDSSITTEFKGDIYSLYFYHRNKQDVYLIHTDGSRCGVSVRIENNLSSDYKVGYRELPKYIKSKLNNNN